MRHEDKTLVEQYMEAKLWIDTARRCNDLPAALWSEKLRDELRARLLDASRVEVKRAQTQLKRATTIANKTLTARAWLSVDAAQKHLDSIYREIL